MSFYLSPTIACHLPGLPWEETVSFYLSPTIACQDNVSFSSPLGTDLIHPL